MPILTCHVDDVTWARLQIAAKRLGRTVDDLAECAIAEAALDDARENRGLQPMTDPRDAVVEAAMLDDVRGLLKSLRPFERNKADKRLNAAITLVLAALADLERKEG